MSGFRHYCFSRSYRHKSLRAFTLDHPFTGAELDGATALGYTRLDGLDFTVIGDWFCCTTEKLGSLVA